MQIFSGNTQDMTLFHVASYYNMRINITKKRIMTVINQLRFYAKGVFGCMS